MTPVRLTVGRGVSEVLQSEWKSGCGHKAHLAGGEASNLVSLYREGGDGEVRSEQGGVVKQSWAGMD